MHLFELKSSGKGDGLEYHKSLNNKLWDEDQGLHKDVRKALMDIAKTFIKTLKIDQKDIEDIIITGSNANYNFSRYSDIDLHIVADYSKICGKCDEFDIDDCFKAKKSLWNDNHNITVKGYTVELYVQPADEKFSGNAGIYSLKNNKWVQKPVKIENLKFDKKLIDSKAKSLITEINDLINNKETNISNINSLKNKIKKMRKSAIARGGEFSLENLVFKALRNKGYIKKLYDYAKNLEDKDLSVK